MNFKEKNKMKHTLESQIQDNKQALLCKINQLIIGERKRFLEQYGQGENAKYYTAKRTLKDEIIAQHLEGERTIGCYYIGSTSKFLCFDIDEPEPDIPLQLLKMLKDIGFEQHELHLEHSGSKGWHIWLFFDGNISISTLSAFGKYFIKELGHDRHCIELRPEQYKNSRGIKLPFAIHRKTMKRTSFLDHYLFPLSDGVQYFLNIVPIAKKRFEQLAFDALETEENSSAILQVSKEYEETPVESMNRTEFIKKSSLNQLAEKLLEFGIPKRVPGDSFGRHYYQYFIALYYKEQGLSEEETLNEVLKWALREKCYKRSNSSEREIIQDVTIDVHHIYGKDKMFYSAIPPEISFSKADIEFLFSVEEIICQYVAWAVLVLGRIYHHNGRFFFSVRQLASVTGLSRSAVHRRLRILIAMNYIYVIEQGEYLSKKSSVYHIPALLDETKVAFTVSAVSVDFQEIFRKSFKYAQQLKALAQ
ncbi:MarR family protein [compost metagenome]